MTLLRPIKPFSPENFVSCNKRLNRGSSTCFLPSVPLKTVRLERVKPLLSVCLKDQSCHSLKE